jgi:predicted enzyme related to lactoylglutathione lyase
MNSTNQPGLFKEIAFVLYPVSDVKAARLFYEGVLGLTVTANWQDQWVEYDIGPGTLAIASMDEKSKPGVHGPLVGLEVANLDATLDLLRSKGVVVEPPFDTPVCRGCFIEDPDKNRLMLHARKAS